MAENKIFSARANAPGAIAAFEAVDICAKARLQPPTIAASDRRHDPEQDHECLARMLGALRHLADHLNGVSYTEALRAADEEYERQGVRGSHLALARQAAVAELAIEACERSTGSPRRDRDGFWPPDTLADLQRYADGQGIGFEAAISRLMVWLLADLQHYADRQGIDFTAAMAAGDRAYTEQRLGAEGPFETGQEPGQRSDTALVPSPGLTAPVPTHQGVITSFADAEWHLVRTAARIDYQARHAPAYPYEPDEDDLLTLSRALAGTCGQSAEQIIIQLTPRIEARIAEIEQGPDTAAELGREHGHAGIKPYCDLDIDGDATALMHALGETEPMTDANSPHRLALVTAYAEAYRQASTQGRAAAASPARIAAQGFPRHPGPPATPARPPRLPGWLLRTQRRAGHGSRPRHGPA
jgi:hypothetical protein